MKLDKEAHNWYGFDHDVVRKRYGDLDGNLEYVGSFCVDKEYKPCAVYYAPNPDKTKGHQNFVLFSYDSVLLQYFVRGRTKKEITPYLKQVGMYCDKCEDVIYSVMRHDMRYCSCKRVSVDGGREYLRSSAEGQTVEIDFITGAIKLL